MLKYRYVPLAQLARMKHDHASVMMALYSFADSEGVCWPSLRTLANACDKPLSTIQVAIKRMVSLGYITVERGRSFVYRIAAHLLAPPKPRLVVDNSVDNCVRSMESPAVGTQSPAGWTEGKTKEKQKQDSKKRRGEVPWRVAPLADSEAGDTTTDVSLDDDDDPPRERDDAYDRGIVVAKRRNMLVRLNGAAALLLRGQVRAEALDLVERAHQIADDDEAWKHRSWADKAALDALKRLADAYHQENGAAVPCRPIGCWQPVEGEVFTAEEKAEIDRRLYEAFLADEQERRAARRRAGRLAA